MTELADWDLLDHAAAGDVGAFRVLVDRHRSASTAFASQVLGDRSGAEDVVQRAFANLYEARTRMTRSASFRSLFYRILLNLSLNELRRRRRDPCSLDAVGGSERDGATVPGATPTRDPADIVAAREVEFMVRRALESLRPEHRAALFLRESQGLAYQEIAATLGATLAEVKIWIFRGRRRVADRLRPYLEHGEAVS